MIVGYCSGNSEEEIEAEISFLSDSLEDELRQLQGVNEVVSKDPKLKLFKVTIEEVK